MFDFSRLAGDTFPWSKNDENEVSRFFIYGEQKGTPNSVLRDNPYPQLRDRTHVYGDAPKGCIIMVTHQRPLPNADAPNSARD